MTAPKGLMAYRKLTQEELLAALTERFGADPMKFAFQCPICADVATIQEFKDLGVDPGRAGQECIGRHLDQDARDDRDSGCDFVAYGLIPGPWEIVLPDSDRTMRAFPIAPALDDEIPHCPRCQMPNAIAASGICVMCEAEVAVTIVDHGPVKPPYGAPARKAYDRDVPPNAGSAS